MTTELPIPETDVPDGETPAGLCPYCDRPFASEHLLWLHLDDRHGAAMTAEQRERAEEALTTERDDLFYYQLKVAVALGVIYSTTALLLMFLLG